MTRRPADIVQRGPRVRLVVLAAVAVVSLPLSVIAQNPTATITVDPTANRHAINPKIYGVAHATTTQLRDLNAPLNRYGGNNTSRYNWQLNADNRGNDWYFESIADIERHGRRARRHLHRQQPRRAARKPMITIPMIDWVAKLGLEPRQAGQLLHRQVRRADRQRLAVVSRRRQRHLEATGQPTSPATIRTTPTCPPIPAFQQGWVQHLVSRWGTAANGGLRYYILDNEPSIWHSTHRDVHPTGATMDEDHDQDGGLRQPDQDGGSRGAGGRPGRVGLERLLLQRLRPAVRQPARLEQPSRPQRITAARTTCPGCSASSSQTPIAGGPAPARRVHRPLLSAGRRVRQRHCRSAMQLLRNRSTRSLWDPNYVDETWINDKVQLIPRLQQLGGHLLLPGHADRHHRIQLGRRRPHQRRHHAGGHLRHLRPRRAGHGRALDDARSVARPPTRR